MDGQRYLERVEGERPLVVGDGGVESRPVQVEVDVDQVTQKPLRIPVVLVRMTNLQIFA